MDSLRYLKTICQSHKIQLLFLIEHLSTVARLSYVRRFLHFDHATSCLDGKIWIFWLQGYSLSFEEFAEQVVHMSCTLLSGDVVTLSAIYAKCTRVGRHPLWHALEQISTNVSGP